MSKSAKNGKRGKKSKSPPIPMDVDTQKDNQKDPTIDLDDYDDNSESFASLFSESRSSTPTKTKAQVKQLLILPPDPSSTLPQKTKDPKIPTLSTPVSGNNKSFGFPRKYKYKNSLLNWKSQGNMYDLKIPTLFSINPSAPPSSAPPKTLLDGQLPGSSTVNQNQQQHLLAQSEQQREQLAQRQLELDQQRAQHQAEL